MNGKKTQIQKRLSDFWERIQFWKKRQYLKNVNINQVKPGESIVEMQAITKRFPGVLANDAINFELKACEIHALLGENGAGKSTLMNILYGLYRSDSGEIKIHGVPVYLKSPKDAIALGIGMVHQHFTLIPTMTVTENIILGQKSSKEPFLNLKEAEKKIRRLSETYSLDVDPKAVVEQLPMGIRQRVEIIKSLYRGARILILDEPTSVLTPHEIEDFFEALKSMVKEGLSVVIITHKLPEVFAISDRVTVLRRGRLIDTVDIKSTDQKALSLKMVGREISSELDKIDVQTGKFVLEVQNVKTMNDKGQEALKGVSFSIQEGEILGIAGISGNGQKELSDVLSGMRPGTAGKIRFLDEEIINFNQKKVMSKYIERKKEREEQLRELNPKKLKRIKAREEKLKAQSILLKKLNPKKLIELGIGDIPEDRSGSGLLMNFSIAENLVLETHTQTQFSKRGFLKNKEIRKNAERIIKEYDVDAPSPNTPVGNLSGGNLQKVLLAKVLSRNPKLLIIAQPTAGLDVGATEFIMNKILKEKERGTAILLISEDLDVVMDLSDRIAVLYEGKIVGIVPTAEAEIDKIGRMMSGVTE